MSISSDPAFRLNGPPIAADRSELEERVAKLASENSQLRAEIARITELWACDRMLTYSIVREGFPESENELLLQARTLPTFSAYLDELERDTAESK